MKSYLWSGADAVIKGRLHRERVPFFLWKDGIIFDQESDMRRALEAFGASAVFLLTDIDNLSEILLLFPNGAVHEDAVHAQRIQLARTKRRYLSLCSSRASALRDAARTTFFDAAAGLKPSRTTFVRAVRQSLLLELKKEGLSSTDYLGARHAELCTASGVRFVQSRPGKVVVFTETIYSRTVKGERVELGEFVLDINFTEAGAGLRFTNLSRVVNGLEGDMHAPNVYASGMPYLDEVEQVWLEYIARFELASVVDLALQFLQNAGKTPLLGQHADQWPIVVNG